jgi:hypothetical protein
VESDRRTDEAVRLIAGPEIDNRSLTVTTFSIEARTCGAPGASWSLEERKVILCYEIAEEFVQPYKLHGEDPLATLSPSTGSRSGAPMGFR